MSSSTNILACVALFKPSESQSKKNKDMQVDWRHGGRKGRVVICRKRIRESRMVSVARLVICMIETVR